jgi:tetratricopeptide (TPR) repeat protein
MLVLRKLIFSTTYVLHHAPLYISVTLRDMGMILEQKGKVDKALVLYHASLRYAVNFIDGKNEQPILVSNERNEGGDRIMTSKVGSNVGNLLRKTAPRSIVGGFRSVTEKEEDVWLDNFENRNVDSLFLLEEVRMESTAKKIATGKRDKAGAACATDNDGDDVVDTENGEMEVFLEKRFDKWALSEDIGVGGGEASFYFDWLFFPPLDVSVTVQPKQGKEETYFDIALTLHQIGQIHRRSHRYDAALSAYKASLRGMRQVLGTQHGIIASILGNIGNLHMDTGDLDEAFNIYQEVLGIETTLLGLSHPEVAVTLHNIATIECSRGNFSDGASFFRQVVDMQKIRFGNEHLTVAVTLSCLADAYEKLMNVNGAIKAYEEALKIRKTLLGESHLDVGRLMHKIGRLASSLKDYATAEIYMNRASEIYNTNELKPDHVFLREMGNDFADIRAQLALRKKK